MLQYPPIVSSIIPNVSFGLPVLAWGLLAVSLPVIVHLFFRERARQEVFPAMRFLIASHTSASRRQWLRHLLLMSARIAVIVLAVSMLGRTGCMRQAGPGASMIPLASPASVVFCIDNSASMGYRYQGQTRTQAAVDWARNLMEDGRYFGPGSQFALVSGTNSPGMGAWREDTHATARLLDTIRPAAHNLPVASLLGRAYSLLSSARHARREVYVFNDLAESSWTDAPPPMPASLTALYVMDVGQDENRNVALGWPQVPSHELAAGTPAGIPIRIVSGDLPGEPVLQFSLDGKPRGRQTAGPLAANSQAETVLNLPALDPGPHWLSIHLEPDDALACDNTRFAWVMAGSLPRVGLVRAGERDEVADMVAAMIAPPALSAGEQRYTVEPIPLASLLTHKLEGLVAIVLADIKGPNGLAWEKLTAYVKSGGTLMIIPGPAFSPPDYQAGAAILPAAIESIADCDPPLRPAVANLSHPYLQPFADVAIDSINDRHAFKRLVLGPIARGASVVFPFADGTPALLESSIGKGRTVLFAFSPAAEWGQFGTQAAPAIVLIHRILEAVRPPLQNVAAYAAGRSPVRAVGNASSPLTVRPLEGAEIAVAPSPAHLYALPADSPQAYLAAEKSNPRDPMLYYSVNVAETESQRLRLASDSLKSRFDKGLVQVVRPGEPLVTGTSSGPVRVNWAVPLGIALILLLLFESSFGNRFYRSSWR